MSKSTKPTAAERNEKVRAVLLAASAPLGPIEIAERIGEDWCMWNGKGFGSVVKSVLGTIGAKSHKGKWELKASPRADIGPTGSDDPIPHHVMPAEKWERLQAQ